MASDDETSGDAQRMAVVQEIVEMLLSGDPEKEVRAAREIRRLTKTSARNRCLFYEAGATVPLVGMLSSPMDGSKEAALLALLNLAVRDERNKIEIVNSGALEPIIAFMQSDCSNLQENQIENCFHALEPILTLSASTTTTKPIISSHGAIPLLVDILKNGSQQAKSDALMALCNLSTHRDNLYMILSSNPVPLLLNILKTINKSSKAAEKCCGLLESLSDFDEGRSAILEEDGGLLTMVELIEDGSRRSRESSVSALLKMCESDVFRFRDAILNEGVIPGLLQMTVQGSQRSQKKAKSLLALLRSSSLSSEKEEDGCVELTEAEEGDKARKVLAEMVQVSMEQSLRHLQMRALVGLAREWPLAN